MPSPPRLGRQLTRATARADVSMSELGALVEQDPAMAAKVLQLVNSAVFGAAGRHTLGAAGALYPACSA
ncbi:MAG: HDOD domain-containing protein [Vicinamibacterales bacterium]